MNISEVEVLVRLVCQSDLTALEVSEGDLRIRLERSQSLPQAAAAVPAPQVVPVAADLPKAADIPPVVDFNHITEIKSPMVGVFYAAPMPGAQPYVSIGKKVKAGDVLCIIEAMKLMNEITAEKDGEIVDICAQDGQIIEYGQTMFKIF